MLRRTARQRCEANPHVLGPVVSQSTKRLQTAGAPAGLSLTHLAFTIIQNFCLCRQFSHGAEQRLKLHEGTTSLRHYIRT